MKKIILKELNLKNFKGVQDFSVNLDADIISIYGANKSGKSTLLSGFYWLLTGKDEFDRKDYEIKNTSHKEFNSRPHEAEATITVNKKEITLKRVYSEKWVKQRRESTPEFQGHKTEFWYNNVPCNATEFQAKLDDIIPANIIKLLTNPHYFNSLQWEKQRAGLLQIAGNITTQQIIDAIRTPANDYQNLIYALDNHTDIEDYRKELRAKKNLLKKKAEEYAPRIDEAKRNKPEPDAWAEIQEDINELNDELETVEGSLEDASKNLKSRQQELLAKQNELYKKQSELQTLKNKITSEATSSVSSLKNEISALESQVEFYKKSIANFRKQLVDNEQNRTYYQQQIERKEATVKQLREDWNKINSEKFEFDESNSICPTCEQEIPSHVIEGKIESLQANFNEDVARRKKEKVDYSNQVKGEIIQLKEKFSSLNDETVTTSISEAEAKITELNNSIVVKENTLANSSKGQDDVIENKLSSNKEYNALVNEIVLLESGIQQEQQKLKSSSEDDTINAKARKQEILIQLDDNKKRLAIKDTIARTEQRIEQLIKEEADNAQAVADVENSEFEVETFVMAKMNILKEKLNSKFGYVKFRLFEKQVNGAIVETCVCEYENVPYPTLNTAAKILAGLDIIETFSNYYQISAPVFIDNRESTSWIPPINSQIINLYVSPADEILRVEHPGSKTAKKQKAPATELFPEP